MTRVSLTEKLDAPNHGRGIRISKDSHIESPLKSIGTVQNRFYESIF